VQFIRDAFDALHFVGGLDAFGREVAFPPLAISAVLKIDRIYDAFRKLD
jgi:hypothetical protein